MLIPLGSDFDGTALLQVAGRSRNGSRANWLSNRVLTSYPDILDHCCAAGNKLTERPWRIMPIGLRAPVLISDYYQGLTVIR